MGGISSAISRTKYESLVPKITAILMMCFGVFLMLAPIIGIEL